MMHNTKESKEKLVDKNSKKEKGKDRPKKKRNFGQLLRIFKYLLPYKVPFIFGLITLILGAAVISTLPYLFGELINIASGVESFLGDDINKVGEILIIALVLQGVFSLLRVLLFARVSENGMADLRHQLYTKYMVLPMRFYDTNRTGELISRITSDIVILQDLFSITLAEFIRQIMTLVISIGFIFYINTELSLFMLLTFPFVILAAGIFGKTIRKFSKKRQDALAFSNVIVEETLQSIQVVKAFTSEHIESLRYRKNLDDVVSIGIKSAMYRGLFISFIIIALFGCIVAMIWKGAYMVQTGEIQVGDLMKFVVFTAFIGGSIAGLGQLFGTIQKGLGATERVLEILDDQEELNITNDHVNKKSLKETIQFKKVSFSYPTRPDVKVLNDFSLSIKSGEKVAFVGHSGAGKSTVVQLLLRFYELEKGNITIGNEDINDIDLIAYRKNIAIVPQEVILFGGTIMENVSYGNPSASTNQIIEAIKKANAYDFVKSFPDGFDTIVGERGVQLSGGQKQRIAIARAILNDPDLLILDEATSSLDAESEYEIQQALDALMEGRTTILIAHRLATIRKVDKIYVMQNGKIVETGNHEELSVIPDGIYKHLVKLQFDSTY